MTMVQNPDPGLTFFTVDDFRPGIISQANYAYQAGDNTSPVPVTGISPTSAAAQPFGTFACMALPSGGLGPLPSVTNTYFAPSGTINSGVTNWITGMTT